MQSLAPQFSVITGGMKLNWIAESWDIRICFDAPLSHTFLGFTTTIRPLRLFRIGYARNADLQASASSLPRLCMDLERASSSNHAQGRNRVRTLHTIVRISGQHT